MAKPHAPASVGPTLPANLGGEHVNGGMSISDPRSPDYAVGQLRDQNAEQPRVELDEDGNILTDAPEPVVVPVKRAMRKAPQTKGPQVDSQTGVYQPAMYVIDREVELPNGKMFQHKAVREDR